MQSCFYKFTDKFNPPKQLAEIFVPTLEFSATKGYTLEDKGLTIIKDRTEIGYGIVSDIPFV